MLFDLLLNRQIPCLVDRVKKGGVNFYSELWPGIGVILDLKGCSLLCGGDLQMCRDISVLRTYWLTLMQISIFLTPMGVFHYNLSVPAQAVSGIRLHISPCNPHMLLLSSQQGNFSASGQSILLQVEIKRRINSSYSEDHLILHQFSTRFCECTPTQYTKYSGTLG